METETVFSFKHPNFKQILEQILCFRATLYVHTSQKKLVTPLISSKCTFLSVFLKCSTISMKHDILTQAHVYFWVRMVKKLVNSMLKLTIAMENYD